MNPEPIRKPPVPYDPEVHLLDMYGAKDEGNPIFPGGFDNFGYWKGIGEPGVPPTLDERVTSQKNMYRRIIEAADVSPDDVVLEVACGRGKGMRLLAETVDPAVIYGVDASEYQVARAIATNEGMNNTYVQCAAAESLPFPAGMFDSAFSLEAIQHFTSPELFTRELGRVVRLAGTIAVASFFTPLDSQTATRQITESLTLPTFDAGIDHAVSIDDMTGWLDQAGFGDIEAVSIGEHVWERFVQWRNMVKQPTNTSWLDAYERNLLDYYMITATKSNV